MPPRRIRVVMLDRHRPAFADLPPHSPCRDCAKFPCPSTRPTLLSCASQKQHTKKES